MLHESCMHLHLCLHGMRIFQFQCDTYLAFTMGSSPLPARRATLQAILGCSSRCATFVAHLSDAEIIKVTPTCM